MADKQEKAASSLPEGYANRLVCFRLAGSFLRAYPKRWSNRSIAESASGLLNNLAFKSSFKGKEGEEEAHEFTVVFEEVTDVRDESDVKEEERVTPDGTMKFASWSGQWARQASAKQREMVFFVGKQRPRTLYQGKIAYVDPSSPCTPGHEEWAYLDAATLGKDADGKDCLFLSVSQPATFRVLFWYDPNGVSTDDWDEEAPRYWYEVGSEHGHGCSWVSYPEKDGEYLCCFDKRRIRVLRHIATMEEARARTLEAPLAPSTPSQELQAEGSSGENAEGLPSRRWDRE